MSAKPLDIGSVALCFFSAESLYFDAFPELKVRWGS
jgi:hypothetical protein